MGTKKKIILILLFPIALMIFAICNGFFLNVLLESIIRKSVLADLGIYGSITVISGIVEVAIMHALLKSYDKVAEKKKTLKWYFDKQLIPMFVVGIITALVLITTRYDDNEGLYLITGAALFPHHCYTQCSTLCTAGNEGLERCILQNRESSQI